MLGEQELEHAVVVVALQWRSRVYGAQDAVYLWLGVSLPQSACCLVDVKPVGCQVLQYVSQESFFGRLSFHPCELVAQSHCAVKQFGCRAESEKSLLIFGIEQVGVGVLLCEIVVEYRHVKNHLRIVLLLRYGDGRVGRWHKGSFARLLL